MEKIKNKLDVIDAQIKINVVLSWFEHPEYYTEKFNPREELKDAYRFLDRFMINNKID